MLIAENGCLCYHILMNEYFKGKISWYKMYAVFLLAALSGVVAWVFNNLENSNLFYIFIAGFTLFCLICAIIAIEIRVRYYFKRIYMKGKHD